MKNYRTHLKGVSSIFAINAGLDRVPRFPLWLRGLVGDEKLIPIGVNQPRNAVVGWYAADHENLRYLVERFPERIGLEYSELKDPSDTDLEKLSEFKSLQWLHVQNASERVLSRLCNGRNLKAINIESYDHAGSMNWTTPKSWRISDRGSECLAKNSALEYVSIKDTSQLSDLGFAQLRDLTKLAGLYLFGPKITDASLDAISELPQLESLGLRGTRVTDGGLQKLIALRHLRELYLRDAPVNDAGIEALKRSLPDLNIRR